VTIIEALQGWIERFNGGIEIEPIEEVLTDRVEASPYSYALAPAGSDSPTKDVTGIRTHRYNYVFFVKAHAGNEVDRKKNYGQLDAFVEWVEEMDDAGDFPALPGGRCVREVTASNAMLSDLYPNGYALYQVQIQMIFTNINNRMEVW